MSRNSSKLKSVVTVPGTVQKVIKPYVSGQPEKAEIAVEGGDPLYREIRIENKLRDADGETVGLKPGAEVEVTIEAEPEATVKKSEKAD
jgi:hypothetical protein